MRQFLKVLSHMDALIVGESGMSADDARVTRPLVLFIRIDDDLRPSLNRDREDFLQTPRLDGFARPGRLIHPHVVQVPTCGASHCALLTGRSPRPPATFAMQPFVAAWPVEQMKSRFAFLDRIERDVEESRECRA